MALRVSGKNLDIGDALRAQIESRVAQALAKYFDGGHRGHVTVAREGHGFRTDCAIHLDSGTVLQAEGRAHDAYQSADGAIVHIEKRLRRYKTRLKKHDGGALSAADMPEAGPEMAYSVIQTPGDEVEEGDQPVIIAETRSNLKNLSVSEAVAELDLTGAPALAFHHPGSGRINVVYRRVDGNIGWIDPSAAKAKPSA